uniref:Uncharacterized protein n=1 Tax=Romanomermis culicivorax TaxID=13658 RepID=A0A915JZJ0_ROMCU
MAIRTKACRDSLQRDVAEALLRLKKDRIFKHCYTNFNQYLIPESSEYFFENLERLCAYDYVPNEEDAVRCRIITTGVNEIQLRIKNIILKIVDVGGQRSERRKWIHCFSDVDSLIFVTSLSEYNMVLTEDSQTNRMKESITLFEKIANCKWFLKKAIILFLNKKDVFEEKLKIFPLSIAFKDYNGPQDFEMACAYIEKQFVSNRKDSNAHIYTHRTCATDTKNVQVVFEACTHIIIKGQLRSAGLM